MHVFGRYSIFLKKMYTELSKKILYDGKDIFFKMCLLA